MKQRAKRRPISKPRAVWAKGNCPACNRESLLDQFYHPLLSTGAKAARRTRRRKAALTRTEPHYDGHVFTPARQGGAEK